MLLLLTAVAPIVAIIIFIYYRDKYEKEPKRLLLFSFLLGAIVSVIITTLLYLITGTFFEFVRRNVWHQFLYAFFIVGLIEEFSKYVIVRYYAQPKEAFNEPFDGIVYAVMVSMGFAATENILYVIEGGYRTALLRAFTAVPAHATFAILMGYFMGKAKFSNQRIKLNLFGLLLATAFHGAYDFFLFINFIPGVWIGAFISLFIGIFFSRKAIISHQRKSHFKN